MTVKYPEHTIDDVIQNTKKLQAKTKEEYSEKWNKAYEKLSNFDSYYSAFLVIGVLCIACALILGVFLIIEPSLKFGIPAIACFIACVFAFAYSNFRNEHLEDELHKIMNDINNNIFKPMDYDIREFEPNDLQNTIFADETEAINDDSKLLKSYRYTDEYGYTRIIRSINEKAHPENVRFELVDMQHVDTVWGDRYAKINIMINDLKYGSFLYLCKDAEQFEKLTNKDVIDLSYIDKYYKEVE